MTVTDGTLLGGRVVYRQPAAGHRSGIEPVFLAASVQARPGARVLEGGSGAGAGLVCLAARIPNLIGVGVEIAPEPLACAQANAGANQALGVRFVMGDLTDMALDLGAATRFDHAIANPPWHPPGTTSPDIGRELARRAPHGVFALWAAALAARLRHRGSMTLVFAAAALPEALADQRRRLRQPGNIPALAQARAAGQAYAAARDQGRTRAVPAAGGPGAARSRWPVHPVCRGHFTSRRSFALGRREVTLYVPEG